MGDLVKVQFLAVTERLKEFGFSHNRTYEPCDDDCQSVQSLFPMSKVWLRCPNKKYGWYPATLDEIEVTDAS